MPTFFDTHEGTDLTNEQREQLIRSMERGEPDEFGVVDRGVILDKDANTMCCVLDAPDEDAIRKHHEAAGVPVKDIHRADAILPR